MGGIKKRRKANNSGVGEGRKKEGKMKRNVLMKGKRGKKGKKGKREWGKKKGKCLFK